MSAITHVSFYPSDWLAGTRGMTAAEMGVYITILAMIYERAGPVRADDMAKLARLCGTSASALKGILERLIADEKLTLTDGHLSNRRAELEIKNVMSKSEVAKANINARWEKRQAKSMPDAYGGNTGEILATSHKPNSTSSLRSDVPRERKKGSPSEALSTVLAPETAQAVVEHRQRMRAPLTFHAAELLARKFAACPDPQAAAEAMMANGWRGFDVAWMERAHSPPNRKPNYVDALNEIFPEASHERPQGQIHNRDAERMAVLDWRPETEVDDVFGGS